jgi:hypothetical protein
MLSFSLLRSELLLGLMPCRRSGTAQILPRSFMRNLQDFVRAPRLVAIIRSPNERNEIVHCYLLCAVRAL